MGAGPHLDDRRHAAQAAFDLDVTLHDDGVGQKGRAVGAEAQVGVAVFQFGGHQHGHPGDRQGRDHALQRLAEVVAEGRRQRQLEARQRVDDHPAGPAAPDLADQQQHDLVDRQIRRLAVEQRDLAADDQVYQHPVALPVGALFEGRDHANFTEAGTLGQERGRQDAFA